MATTTDVHIWGIRTNQGVRRTTYTLRWQVAGRVFCKTHRSKTLATSQRTELNRAARRGVPFDIYTGVPITQIQAETAESTWYDHAVAFMDMKWPTLQPGSRRNLAAALASVTAALTTQRRGRPDHRLCLTALINWSFNRTTRMAGDPPPEFAAAITWIRANSLNVSALSNPRTLRMVYDATLVAPNGKRYAADTHRNKMKALSGAIRYAIELELLERNPLDRISTTSRPHRSAAVDRRVVVNPAQARCLISAVSDVGTTGPRYVALFATMYFAGLRPAELLALRAQDCVLPDQGWGELCFAESSPYVGAAWTDDGTNGPRKALKHRAANESRTVPAHPELVAHLRNHIEQFGTATDGRLFTRSNGGDIRYGTFSSIWSRARKDALTDFQFNSPLAKRPYDLRHACLSTWLNAGVAAPQVAEWAGHNVQMLLSTYAKCIDGQHARDRQRIAEALAWSDGGPASSISQCNSIRAHSRRSGRPADSHPRTAGRR